MADFKQRALYPTKAGPLTVLAGTRFEIKAGIVVRSGHLARLLCLLIKPKPAFLLNEFNIGVSVQLVVRAFGY